MLIIWRLKIERLIYLVEIEITIRSLIEKIVDNLTGPSIRPNDRIMKRLTSFPIPGYCRFPLIGDSNTFGEGRSRKIIKQIVQIALIG